MEPVSVINNFEKDLENFLEKFSNEKDFNFKSFSNIWKNEKYFLIFHGLLHVNELHEFIDNVNELCLKKFILEENYSKKVCLIFFIYSVYYKQPDENKFNFRIDKKNYYFFEEFLKNCELKNNYETIFCWRQLLADGAIDFVHQINYYGPWFVKRQKFDKELVSMDSIDNDFLRNIRELSDYQTNYDLFKKNIENENELSNLNLIENKNLYNDYLDKLKELRKKYNKF